MVVSGWVFFWCGWSRRRVIVGFVWFLGLFCIYLFCGDVFVYFVYFSWVGNYNSEENYKGLC